METHSLFDKKEIDSELKIGSDLFVESQRTPNLHNKLNVILLELQRRKTAIQQDYYKMFKERWEYYTGKASPEIYKQCPFPFRILKGDLEIYINSDSEISRIKKQLQEIESEINYISEALKQVGQRSYLIRNMISYLEYLNGLN